jgi:succinyl-CoA synthetase beta subunit
MPRQRSVQVAASARDFQTHASMRAIVRKPQIASGSRGRSAFVEASRTKGAIR